jgi:hypothetical protein
MLTYAISTSNTEMRKREKRRGEGIESAGEERAGSSFSSKNRETDCAAKE